LRLHLFGLLRNRFAHSPITSTPQSNVGSTLHTPQCFPSTHIPGIVKLWESPGKAGGLPNDYYARSGDLLLAASVSGDSPNLVKAFEWANAQGLETAAIVGAKRGRLADIARQTLVVADTHYGRVEDVQMHIFHMLCYAFMEVPELAKTSN